MYVCARLLNPHFLTSMSMASCAAHEVALRCMYDIPRRGGHGTPTGGRGSITYSYIKGPKSGASRARWRNNVHSDILTTTGEG